MRRRKLILWHIPGPWPALGSVTATEIEYSGVLLEQLGAEWTVVSHTVAPTDSGGIMLSLWVETDATIAGYGSE